MQKVLGRISSVIGLLLILLVVAICLPLTVPRVAGYEVYAIVSGSMEPAIPTGSLVYAKRADPAGLVPGEIVVFYGGQGADTVITHRVVENNAADQEIVTRGDANADNDVSPIPYRNVIGKVGAHVPLLGLFLPVISTMQGKLCLLGVLAAAVLLRVVGARMISAGRKRKEAEAALAAAAIVIEKPKTETKPKKRKKKSVPLLIMILILLGGMAFSGYKLGSILLGYYRDRAAYSDLANQVVTDLTKAEGAGLPDKGFDRMETGPEGWPTTVPISVDWESLQSKNSDVVGWLYMPDTAINYPVMQTTDNDFYLHRDMNGVYSAAGTLFVDATSVLNETLSNYIIYGHHMRDGSMFASIDRYSTDGYYDAHPYLFYLTPDGNYRVDLISAHIVESVGDFYQGAFLTMAEYQAYLDEIMSDSLFETAADVTTEYQLMSLSTCNYSNNYRDPRMLVQGLMIPID